MTKKINLIFDLDETLVQLGEENYNNKGIYVQLDRGIIVVRINKLIYKLWKFS